MFSVEGFVAIVLCPEAIHKRCGDLIQRMLNMKSSKIKLGSEKCMFRLLSGIDDKVGEGVVVEIGVSTARIILVDSE